MARKEKKYHIIYKTTNQINGKFYVGMHSTDNLNDNYLGSGYKLKRSVNKYGKENFKMGILEYLPNRRSLKVREAELVNEDLLKDPMCMNLVFGGNGGFISPEGCKKGAKRMNEIVWANPEYRKRKSEWKSEQNKILWETGVFKYVDNWTGKHHKEESKIQIGKSNSIIQKGEGNSQFGTCWITNETESKKIFKGDIIPEGWRLGRKIK
jgi:hypothetical protein